MSMLFNKPLTVHGFIDRVNGHEGPIDDAFFARVKNPLKTVEKVVNYACQGDDRAQWAIEKLYRDYFSTVTDGVYVEMVKKMAALGEENEAVKLTRF